MPSPSALRWLIAKEWRDLMASRAWWATLALTGPLVGVSFIDAVRGYAEISAGAGAGCGSVCAPLDGIWGPTFGAFEIVAIFLFPFVAIRAMSGDRQSGALKLELQRRVAPFTRVAAKVWVLLAGWMLCSTAALAAIGLWMSYGGPVYLPEITVVFAGHLLNASLAIALAMAAASITEHPSTAAIVTLGVTVGTWIVAFAAAIHGGIWERLAAYTPAALVGVFQRGLVLVDVVLIALVLTAAGLAIAQVWMPLGLAVRRRLSQSLRVAAVAALAIALSTRVHASWDASHSRHNSFAEADEQALEAIAGPLSIDVHLAPQDPRRLEFERRPLAKLRRVRPDTRVTYAARTAHGLYEEADPGYGEIWYSLGGRREMSRVVTDEGVLETIYALAGVPANTGGEPEYQGDPLTAEPAGAAFIFYVVWPACVAAIAFRVSRRPS